MIKSLSSSEQESDALDAADCDYMIVLVNGAEILSFICDVKFAYLLSVSQGNSCSGFFWGVGLGFKDINKGLRSWQSLRLGMQSGWSI